MKQLFLVLAVFLFLFNSGCDRSGSGSGSSEKTHPPKQNDLFFVLDQRPFQTNCKKIKTDSYSMLELKKVSSQKVVLNILAFDDEYCTNQSEVVGQYFLSGSGEVYSLAENNSSHAGHLTLLSLLDESFMVALKMVTQKSDRISQFVDIREPQTFTAYNNLNATDIITTNSKLKLEEDSFFKNFTSAYDCRTSSNEDLQVVKLSYVLEGSTGYSFRELYISLNSSNGELNFYSETFEGQSAIPYKLSSKVNDSTFVWDVLKTQKLIKMDEYGHRKLWFVISLDPKNAYIDIPQDAMFEHPAKLEVTKIKKQKFCGF